MLSPTVPVALQHAQILCKRPDLTTVLLCHDPRNLVKMRQVMRGPCSQQLRKRNRPQRRMASAQPQL